MRPEKPHSLATRVCDLNHRNAGKELNRNLDVCKERIVQTSQHSRPDMGDVVVENLQITESLAHNERQPGGKQGITA